MSRLCLIAPWLENGGADKFNLDALEQLAQRGWQCAVITTAPSHNPSRQRFAALAQVMRAAGRLVRVNADVGDGVARGETVAVLDDKEYAAQYEQSRADLEVMQATLEDAGSSLETARRDLERARTLFEGKIASQTELDSAATALRKAETQHRVVQAQRKQKDIKRLVKFNFIHENASFNHHNNERGIVCEGSGEGLRHLTRHLTRHSKCRVKCRVK